MSSASVKLPQLGTGTDCFPVRVMVMVMDVFDLLGKMLCVSVP